MAKKFSQLERDAWGGFLNAFSRIDRLIEQDLQTHSHISHVEFEVLLRLALQPDHRLRIQDLAAQSILTRSGTSRLVERLEKTGLVTREGASEDRRGAYAILTEAGLARFQAAADAHTRFVRKIFIDRFTADELTQMAEFWARLED